MQHLAPLLCSAGDGRRHLQDSKIGRQSGGGEHSAAIPTEHQQYHRHSLPQTTMDVMAWVCLSQPDRAGESRSDRRASVLDLRRAAADQVADAVAVTDVTQASQQIRIAAPHLLHLRGSSSAMGDGSEGPRAKEEMVAAAEVEVDRDPGIDGDISTGWVLRSIAEAGPARPAVNRKVSQGRAGEWRRLW